MSREILIQIQKDERLVAITEKGTLEDFYIEVDRYQSLLGNIYKGKVESILPSINAAFVNIGQERNGFLYLTDAVSPRVDQDQELEPFNFISRFFRKPKTEEPKAQDNSKDQTDQIDQASQDESKKSKDPKDPKDVKGSRKNFSRKRGRSATTLNMDEIPFKVGQEILVQVVKDPFHGKGARLTTHVTLPGRFVVHMPYDKQVGISKKIEDSKERQRLREVIKELNFAKSGGFIIRTASLSQSKADIVRDAKFLYQTWVKIQKKSDQEKAPALIYEEGALTWKIVRDYLTEKVDKLVIDSEVEYERIKKFAQTLIGKQIVKKIHYYNGRAPLFDSKNISKQMQTIYDTNVYCKSGAYVVIEQTEGLIVVDVNSGKFKAKASPGEAAFMVNMEVVPEIARQLRLRDLGGIIVIDFIDMTREDHKRKVVDALQRALARDHAKTEVYKISPLGLVEMTRARTGKTVESMSFGKCPFCDGRGRVKTP